MNVENINKVIEALKADRDKPVSHFKMAIFGQIIDYGKDPVSPGYQVCNTAMCIAGWANTIRMVETNDPALLTREYFCKVDAREDARAWLDIDEADAEHIFFMSNSKDSDCQDAIDAFDAAPSAPRYAAAIELLTHLRDTGEANWQRALRLHGLDEIAELIDKGDEY